MISSTTVRLEHLPAIAQSAFRRYDYALRSHSVYMYCQDAATRPYWKQATRDDAFLFEDALRCYLSYGEFVHRQTALELLRLRRMLISKGLLSKIEWSDDDR